VFSVLFYGEIKMCIGLCYRSTQSAIIQEKRLIVKIPACIPCRLTILPKRGIIFETCYLGSVVTELWVYSQSAACRQRWHSYAAAATFVLSDSRRYEQLEM